MEINFMPKNADFYCNLCDFKCYKKSNYDIHVNTKKHINRVNGNKMETMEIIKNANCNCDCGKHFKTNSGLWKHKKKCHSKQPEVNEINEPSDKELIMMLIKDNSEFKNMMMKVLENGTHNTTTTTHTNSHNKAFNLQFFLNETCKNAMNITDFVDSIKLQLSDFMNVGEVGFVEGISNIIIKNLNSLDETIRPIHCTDQKRETFYVKDENIWQKEEEDKIKLNKLIRGIAYKNEKLMKVYKETYPDYNDPQSRRSDQYSKTVIEAMDCKEDSREKIIRKISKATTISTK